VTVSSDRGARLTRSDLETLRHCDYVHRKHGAGIFPASIGDRSHFAKLVRMGLLVFSGWGEISMESEITMSNCII